MPPYLGAMARFGVRKGRAEVSVYLDVNSRLCGRFSDDHWPHWEIYPDATDDNLRIAMDNVNELITEIENSLEVQERAARKVEEAA